MSLPVTGFTIQSALATIRGQPQILQTPTVYSSGLSAYLSREYGFPVHVCLKLESLQAEDDGRPMFADPLRHPCDLGRAVIARLDREMAEGVA